MEFVFLWWPMVGAGLGLVAGLGAKRGNARLRQNPGQWGLVVLPFSIAILLMASFLAAITLPPVTLGKVLGGVGWMLGAGAMLSLREGWPNGKKPPISS